MAWPNSFSTDGGAMVTAAGIEHPERWSWDGYLQNYAYVQPHTAESLAAWKNFLNDPAMKSGYAEQQRQAEEDKDFDFGNLIDNAIIAASTGMIGAGAFNTLSGLLGGVNPGTAGLVDAAALEGGSGAWPTAISDTGTSTFTGFKGTIDPAVLNGATGANAGGATLTDWINPGTEGLNAGDQIARAPSLPLNSYPTSGTVTAPGYVGPELATTSGQPNLWAALPATEQGTTLAGMLSNVPPGTGTLLSSLGGGGGGGAGTPSIPYGDVTNFSQDIVDASGNLRTDFGGGTFGLGALAPAAVAAAATGASGGTGTPGGGTGTPGGAGAAGSLPSWLLSAAGPVLGALIQSGSASTAAGAQDAATQQAIAEQRRQYDTNRADLEPWRTTGGQAVNRLGDLMGISGRTAAPGFGDLTKKFTLADFWDDPVTKASYQSGLDLGTKQLTNTAAARGSLNSGATLKALSRFGTDYTGRQAGDSYNRFYGDQDRIFNRLSGLAGTGQTAATNTASLGAGSANTIGNLISNQGNARGAAAIAGGNAIGGALGTLSNNYNQQQMLNQLLGSRSYPASVYGTGGGPAPWYGSSTSWDGE